MKYGSLVLEKKDFAMIKRYQQLNHYMEDYWHKDALDKLDENMVEAIVMNLDEIPDDVIRLYSKVTVTSKSGWIKTFELVLPYEHDSKNHKISVLRTLGASVIGLSEGDSLNYRLPGNILALIIEKVEQREPYINVDKPEEIIRNVLPMHYKK